MQIFLRCCFFAAPGAAEGIQAKLELFILRRTAPESVGFYMRLMLLSGRLQSWLSSRLMLLRRPRAE